MKLLVIAENGNAAISAIGFAKKLGLPYAVLQLSGDAADCGADSVFLAGFNEIPTADAVSASIAEFAQSYSHLAMPSSMFSKDLLARIAGHLDAAMVTDVIAIHSRSKFDRPIFAGSVIETVETQGLHVAITFRPANFEKAEPLANGSVETVELAVQSSTRRTSKVARGGSRPDLSQAKIVVSGGRPLKDAATFESVIGGFADALGAAVGATRAAVDSGIAPNELQVGQTGKVVAPDLYIAAGISGSTQHMAGIKDSKLIVAINKDPDAPIFDQCDLGLVADLFDALPELRSQLGL